MLQAILLIILGFFLLIFGADLLVRGSSNIAKRFHIPETLIGLTIVAIGTSMPELMITISSAQKGATDLIIGNSIGSNLCNLLLVLGVTTMLRPIKLEKDVKTIHFPVAYISTLTLLIMGIGLYGSEKGIINRADAKILLLFYLIYSLYPIFIEAKDIWKTWREDREKYKKNKVLSSIIYIIISVILLKVGGDLVVEEASNLALFFGLSQSIIGLTIVAIGTSLPEMITSVLAVVKGEEGLAVGNLIGSCILNIFLVIGVGALITPLAFSDEFIRELLLLLVSVLFIWISCFIGKKDTITRYKAGVLLVLFVYHVMKLFR